MEAVRLVLVSTHQKHRPIVKRLSERTTEVAGLRRDTRPQSSSPPTRARPREAGRIPTIADGKTGTLIVLLNTFFAMVHTV